MSDNLENYCVVTVLSTIVVVTTNCRMEVAQKQFREVAQLNVSINNRLQQTDQRLIKLQQEKKKIDKKAASTQSNLQEIEDKVTSLEVLLGSAELEIRQQKRKSLDANKRAQRFADREKSVSQFRKAANVAHVKSVRLEEELVSAHDEADAKVREISSLRDEADDNARQNQCLKKQNAKLKTKLNLFRSRQVSVRGHRQAVDAAVSRADELGQAIEKIKEERDATVARVRKDRDEAVTTVRKERDEAVARLRKERDDAVAR